MIITLLIFSYILITSYVIGFAVIELMTRKEGGYKCRSMISYILAGLCFQTVYAQAFSLVAPVGLWANVIMILITIVIVMLFRTGIFESVRNGFSSLGKIKSVVIIVLFLLFAYGTSHGIMHYDSDLYHAQSIRWIEEYGCVKGLGNLHTRLAYNSASFCLSALFSLSFLLKQSYHVCAGFLAFVLACLCTGIVHDGGKVKLCLSTLSRLVAIYYLLIIFDEMVSPASDYFMVLLTLCCSILFLDVAQTGETSPTPYALISLATLVILSVKISGALLVLLAAYPAILLIGQKKVGQTVKYLILGIVTVTPFLIRNVILSGYLLYPVAGVDIFDFDFKIPKGLAMYDAKEIQVYGRGFSDVNRFDESIGKWIGEWFSSLDAINKISFIAGIVGIALLVIMITHAIIKHDTHRLPFLIITTVINVSFLLWLFTSPNIRYGCVFLWLAPVLTWGTLLERIQIGKIKDIIFQTCVIIFFVYKAATFITELAGSFTTQYIICQQDYGRYEAVEYEIKGITFYRPVEGDRIGYDHFPASVFEGEATLIKDDIIDGFMSCNPSE